MYRQAFGKAHFSIKWVGLQMQEENHKLDEHFAKHEQGGTKIGMEGQ